MSPNRLAGATSPYLLQHADNPVDWYPWGPEALERARREDKPILLSIGYAACHWCHVMAHESFEDPETAALMNRHFVCVKVDREERPDVDAIYMDAVQALTGHGGWPLTAFLTPEGKPFYAGTYYPKEDRHGLPAFRRVLEAIAEVWAERRSEAETQAERVTEAISRVGALRASGEPLSEEVAAAASRALREAFDPVWGGFGAAPKFPQPMTLELLLRRHLRGDPEALPMLERTLDAMAAGGIHDRVGGGFHRYATDERWHVPHFEKMLPDNAQLARLYARAWQVTGRPAYREVAARTCEYLLRELRQPGGGFSSSQDADSEGVEGRFYVWGWDELAPAVGEPAARALGASPGGNWEGGANVLWMPRPLEEAAAELGLAPDALAAEVDAARERLLELRERRVRPATDDKVVAAWNGLAISALAEAGRVLGEPRYVDAAVEAAGFVLGEMRSPDGRLARSWRAGRLGGPGYADDHALLAEACLVLYETTWDLRWFEEALRLAEELLTRFHDPERETHPDGREHAGLAAGIRFLLGEPVLRRMSLAWLVFVLGMGMGMVADAPIAESFGAGATGFGFLIAAWGSGSVLGAVAGRWMSVRTEPVWLVLGSACIAVAAIGVGHAPWFWLVLVALFAMGTADGLTIVAENGIMQRRTPDAVRSRTMAAFEALLSLGLFVAYLAAIPLLRAVEPQRVYLIGGLAATGAAVVLVPLLALRREAVEVPEIERELPVTTWESRVE